MLGNLVPARAIAVDWGLQGSRHATEPLPSPPAYQGREIALSPGRGGSVTGNWQLATGHFPCLLHFLPVLTPAGFDLERDGQAERPPGGDHLALDEIGLGLDAGLGGLED